MLNAGCKNRKSSKLTTSAFGTIVACSLSLSRSHSLLFCRVYSYSHSYSCSCSNCLEYARSLLSLATRENSWHFSFASISIRMARLIRDRKGRVEREGYGERGRESKVGQASNGFSFCRVWVMFIVMAAGGQRERERGKIKDGARRVHAVRLPPCVCVCECDILTGVCVCECVTQTELVYCIRVALKLIFAVNS